MSELIGKLLIRERCGEKAFSKYIKTEDFDGGFTRVNEFEKIPGWDCAPKENDDYGTLCPNCYLAYKQTLKNFWSANIKSASQEITLVQ